MNIKNSKKNLGMFIRLLGNLGKVKNKLRESKNSQNKLDTLRNLNKNNQRERGRRRFSLAKSLRPKDNE